MRYLGPTLALSLTLVAVAPRAPADAPPARSDRSLVPSPSPAPSGAPASAEVPASGPAEGPPPGREAETVPATSQAAAPSGASAAAFTPGPRVLVSRMGVDRRMAPAPAVRVLRERLKRSAGMEGGETLVAVWETRTDAGGVATFTDVPLGAGEEDRYAAMALGTRWPAEVSPDAPTAPTVTIFERTRDLGALALDLQVGLELRDANFMIQQQFVVINDGLQAVDLTDGPGLRVPLLTHAVFGASLDSGFLPLRPDTRTSRFEVTPPGGRVSVERGALVFRGVVPPGRAVQIRASFAVPFGPDARHTLALRSDLPFEGLRFGVTAPDASGLKVALGAPHDTAARRAGDGTELWLVPRAMPAVGEVVTLHVANTPDRLATQRDVGLALGFGVLFALTAVFAGSRRRG